MATISIETIVDADPAAVWDALRDFGALHERLAPGFAIDTRLDGTDRLVTFFNGVTLRERLITTDDDARRLVWSIVGGPYLHHNGAAQVFEHESGARFVWTADVLPDETEPRTREMMQRGLETIRLALASSRSAA
jgi:Polyketide cyclase / dehydrase and lipid transport